MRLIVLAAVALVASAGCIGVAKNANEAPLATDSKPSVGEMDGKETATTTTAPCLGGGVDLPGPPRLFCATRTVTLEGTLSLARLPVVLSTFDGPVEVQSGPAGEWKVVVALHASGVTPDDAIARLDDISFVRGHSVNGGHVLRAQAKLKTGSQNNDAGYGADIRVTLPASLVLSLSGTTTNGAVTVQGVTTDGLMASTTNGGITVGAAVTSVSLATTNGAIGADLTPRASGGWRLDSTNGKIALTVPEDAAHGYRIEAHTTNGRVTSSLHDGATSSEGDSGARFVTSEFGRRAVQVDAALATTNGAIEIRSA